MRLVIPAGAASTDVAFQGKTWQEIADDNGADGIQTLGDQWCVDNHVDGLGLADVYVAPPDPGQPVRTADDKLADAHTILAEAAGLPSPVTPADLADILTRAAAALDGGA